MEHGYSLINGEKQPLYRKPKGVYIAELSIGVKIFSVKTEKEGFITERSFFGDSDIDKRKMIEVIERRFGKLDCWKEVSVS